jgi:hypothetical protein
MGIARYSHNASSRHALRKLRFHKFLIESFPHLTLAFLYIRLNGNSPSHAVRCFSNSSIDTCSMYSSKYLYVNKLFQPLKNALLKNTPSPHNVVYKFGATIELYNMIVLSTLNFKLQSYNYKGSKFVFQLLFWSSSIPIKP